MLSVDRVDSLFSFVVAAAKRMRQLQVGARPLVETHAKKPIKIAQEELLSGVLKYELPDFVGEVAEEKKRKKSSK